MKTIIQSNTMQSAHFRSDRLVINLMSVDQQM
jgi:hypothetical protein